VTRSDPIAKIVSTPRRLLLGVFGFACTPAAAFGQPAIFINLGMLSQANQVSSDGGDAAPTCSARGLHSNFIFEISGD
jgi:hypothetical protein